MTNAWPINSTIAAGTVVAAPVAKSRIINLTGLRFDKNGMPIYTYDWNGEDVSEDEYNADFAQVYDSSAATEGYDTDKLESIKEVIDDIETK